MFNLSLEKLLYLDTDDSILIPDIPHPSDRKAAVLPSLQTLTKSQAAQTLGTSFNINKSHILTIFL